MSQKDWDRLQYYSRKVKFFGSDSAMNVVHPRIHPSTYFRIGRLRSSVLFPSLRQLQYFLDDGSVNHIFLFLSPLLDSLELFNIKGFENAIVGPFFATLSSESPMLRQIILRNGQMPVEVFKKSIVHFKQLHSLELSDAVFMSDFALLEVLGTLPSLANFTLVANDPASHPSHAPENYYSKSGGPKYFLALEHLRVTGTFFLIRHILISIDSPFLKTIYVRPVIVKHARNEHEPEDLFAHSMMMVSIKWPQSVEKLIIHSSPNNTPKHSAMSKRLISLMHLHKMQRFFLDWKMTMNTDDNVRRLVMSWPQLKSLNLNETVVSLPTLRIIAENCPELRRLYIRLDTSTITPFDTSGESLRHHLEVLTIWGAHPSSKTILESQIQVTRHLDFLFPYLKSLDVQPNNVFWLGIRDLLHLCQDAGRSRGWVARF